MPFFATVIACWIGLSCFLVESRDNPFKTKEACEAEVQKMVKEVSTTSVSPYGLPSSLASKCLTEAELKELLGE